MCDVSLLQVGGIVNLFILKSLSLFLPSSPLFIESRTMPSRDQAGRGEGGFKGRGEGGLKGGGEG